MKKKRRLSQQDLRAMGVTPGLMAHRVGPDGRSRLEQLTTDTRPRPPFGVGLTQRSDVNETSEGEG